jgi:uracil-DNA glycosylase
LKWEDLQAIRKDYRKIKKELNLIARYMEEKLYVMPLFHPSYLLRNASREKGSPKWLTWQDIQEVRVAYDFYQQSAST